MYEWWCDQGRFVKIAVALGFLAVAAGCYFGLNMILWWSWAIGGVLLLFALFGGD